jgi:hypothetical protein
MYNVSATMMLLGHDISLKDLYKPQARARPLQSSIEFPAGLPFNMSQQKEVWKSLEDFEGHRHDQVGVRDHSFAAGPGVDVAVGAARTSRVA